MNAKKAKQLRNLAKNSTLGMPMVDYYGDYRPAQYVMFQGTPIKTEKGIPKELAATCVRKVYQNLKRDHKAA